MTFPWVTSRTLLFSPHGRFDLEFPPDFPLVMQFLDFTREHLVTPSYHECLEVSFVYSGEGRFAVEDRSYDLGEGDAVLVGPREFHLIEAGRSGRMRVIALHFQPELVCASRGSALEFEYLRPFYLRNASFSNRVAAADLAGADLPGWLARIHDALRSGESWRCLAARTYLLHVLLAIARARAGCDVEGRAKAAATRDGERLQAAFDYVRSHYKESFELDDVAREAGMSRSYFCRSFRRATGTTLTGYVLRLRIDHAIRLLAATDMSITEVAYDAGFSSHSYFDRVFRRLTGQAPQEFRAASGQLRASRGQSGYSRAAAPATY